MLKRFLRAIRTDADRPLFIQLQREGSGYIQMKKTGKRALLALVITAVLSLSPFGAICAAAQEGTCDGCETVSLTSDVQVSSRFLELFFNKKDAKKNGASEELMLCPGGDVFGIKIKEDHVTVIEAKSGLGIQSGDVLYSINGKTVKSVEDVKRAVEEYREGTVKLCVMRDGTMLELEVTPVADGDTYKLGLALRDGAAGIGTVTFTDPATGSFAGLGHGICDSETGELIPLKRGAVMEAEINGVVRGEQGNPGELKGYLCSKKIGTLLINCDKGVFGVLSTLPEELGEVVEVGNRDTIHSGVAYLRCTLSDGKVKQYAIELSDIAKENKGTKCFSVHVTDPDLLKSTGGIVQGMSGSPILQDGKLVGAVTHVLVGDPTRGYGIFVENMLAQTKSI